MARGRRTDDDEAIAGYGPEDAAAAAPEPAAVSEDDQILARANASERESVKRIEEGLRLEWEATKALFYPPLIKRFGEDVGERMWRAIEPVLKAGPDFARRERFKLRPVKAA